MESEKFEVELHVIIRHKESDKHAPAFGRGIARLCELVEKTGSLNKACKEMGMAYSKAWRIIRNSEESLGVSLLERYGAKGSVLTQEAKKLVRVYRRCETTLRADAQEVLAKALREE